MSAPPESRIIDATVVFKNYEETTLLMMLYVKQKGADSQDGVTREITRRHKYPMSF
jgi:hypothetical protein